MMAGGVKSRNFEDLISDFEKRLGELIPFPESSLFRSKKKRYNGQEVQTVFSIFSQDIQMLDDKPTCTNFTLAFEKIRGNFLSRVHEEQLHAYHKCFHDIQVVYNNYQRTLDRNRLVKLPDSLISQYVRTLHAVHEKSQVLTAAAVADDDIHSHGSGGGGHPVPVRTVATIIGTAAQQKAFADMLSSLGQGEALERKKAQVAKNLKSFEDFFRARTATPAECQRALAYLESNRGIQSLATETGYKNFLIQNVITLHEALIQATEIENGAKALPSNSEGLSLGTNPIHGISAGNWYHNKASDRDMQLSQLWDEVIRYSTGRTADAERQRVLSMGAAEALNRLAADPSADVPENFASLLRGVITSLDAKSAGAGAMDKAEAVKGIVIDRKGEAVADDHPELRARLNALSEADLHNVCRNLRRVQQDLLEENASQPFRQAFTRAYLSLPTRIEKLIRINGYERYKVRESKAWEQYRAYYTLLGQPEPRDVTSPFFTPLSQLETGSLLEQDGTLRQLEENLRQFTAFCQKETTPEDQRQFVREYLQTETAIAHLASKSSFAHFQAALRARPSAPPKSAMRNEPTAAAVFAPSAPMAASAPPLPIANEIPPLQASLAAKGGRGDQINAAQGAFLTADALNMPIAPSGEVAASAPPLPTELKKEAVKELVLE